VIFHSVDSVLSTRKSLFQISDSFRLNISKLGFGVMVFYIGTGLLLGIMTLMDDGMELALGFHLGNNLMAALLITSDFSALQTDAVFKYSSEVNSSNALTEMIISIAIMYPLILFSNIPAFVLGFPELYAPVAISHNLYTEDLMTANQDYDPDYMHYITLQTH